MQWPFTSSLYYKLFRKCDNKLKKSLAKIQHKVAEKAISSQSDIVVITKQSAAHGNETISSL